MTITFQVHGEPKAQPRPRAFARKMGDKFVARVFEAGTAEGWKSLIATAAKPHAPAVPYTCPVRVDVTFIFPRPKIHHIANKPERRLRSDAPQWHTKKPDRDNLDKALYYFKRVRRYHPNNTKALEAGVKYAVSANEARTR